MKYTSSFCPSLSSYRAHEILGAIRNSSWCFCRFLDLGEGFPLQDMHIYQYPPGKMANHFLNHVIQKNGFYFLKNRRVGHVHGLVLCSISTVVQHPLDPPRHRHHQVPHYLLSLLFRGRVNMTEAFLPPYQLYLSDSY